MKPRPGAADCLAVDFLPGYWCAHDLEQLHKSGRKFVEMRRWDKNTVAAKALFQRRVTDRLPNHFHGRVQRLELAALALLCRTMYLLQIGADCSA